MYVSYAGDLYVAIRLYASLVSSALKKMENVPPDQMEIIVKDGKFLFSMINQSFGANAKKTNVDGKNLNLI